MAKPAAKTKPPAEDKSEKTKKSNLPPRREYAYDISTLAEAVGKKPTGVRVLLRKLEIEKNEGRYGWDSKADYEAVLKQLKNAGAADADEKPASKAPAKKSTKKAA